MAEKLGRKAAEHVAELAKLSLRMRNWTNLCPN